MVKNTHGGNKSKGLARKQMHSSSDSLLVPSSELEFIGVVTKMLGNGMFYVNDIMDSQFLGHIRNKFKGKSKHQNNISIGSIVLLGFRHWEKPNFKNVDLISLYDSNDIHSLSKSFQIPSISTHSLSHDILFHHNDNDTTHNDTNIHDTHTDHTNIHDNHIHDIHIDDI